MTLSAVHVPAPVKSGPVVYTDQQLLRVLVHLAQGGGHSQPAHLRAAPAPG